MKKVYFKKGIVFGIIFLFIGAGVIPTISASTENKEILSIDNIQSPPQSLTLGNYILIGFLNQTEKGPWNDDNFFMVWTPTVFGLILGIDTYGTFCFEIIQKGEKIFTLGKDKEDSLFDFYKCIDFEIYF